jgi:hypothetical protein
VEGSAPVAHQEGCRRAQSTEPGAHFLLFLYATPAFEAMRAELTPWCSMCTLKMQLGFNRVLQWTDQFAPAEPASRKKHPGRADCEWGRLLAKLLRNIVSAVMGEFGENPHWEGDPGRLRAVRGHYCGVSAWRRA